MKPSQVHLLINANLALTQYAAIKINLLEFEAPAVIERAVFSSQNAVESFKKHNKRIEIAEAYCVGVKTAEKLKEIGINVIKTTENSKELADFLKKSFENEDFYFLCGTMRRDELPDIVNSSKNRLFEVKTYETVSNPNKIDGFFDGIMFFSPSGVHSFMMNNEIGKSNVICIGETTASAVRQITNKVYVANSQTVESVIAKTAKILKDD